MFFPRTIYFTTPKPSGYYENSVEIRDKHDVRDLRRDKIYILRHKTNDALAIFRMLFPLGLKIILYTDNFDHFFYAFRQFRNFHFAFLDECEETADIRSAYLDAERRILERRVEDSECLKEQQSNVQRSNRTYTTGIEKSRGVELSFEPRVFESIRSSLLNPEKYLHTASDMSSRIYCELFKGKKTLEQLREALGCDFDKELKSLIFTSIVKAKDGHFYV